VLGRRNAEHWVALLYTRRVSLHLTRWLAGTGVRANTITYLMVVVGLGASALLVIPGVPGAVAAAVGIQVYLLLDCSDGELARWQRSTSARGVYLDRLGHYLVEATFFFFLGWRVGGSLTSGWTTLGVATALLAVLAKVETDLVAATVGPANTRVDERTVTPRSPWVRRLRSLTHPLKVHRATGAVEASLLVVVAAVLAATVWAAAEEALLLFFLAVAAALVAGHGLSILASNRLNVDPAGDPGGPGPGGDSASDGSAGGEPGTGHTSS
jgi:phosphatidylglycerophosphate synthase